MKFTIKNHKVVFYYDKPLVVVSGDKDSFFISLAEPEVSDEIEPWLVCKVDKNSFELFLNGQTDLLSIMNQETTSFGTFNIPFFDEDLEYEVTPISREIIPEAWFPGPGFKLRGQP